MSIGLTIGAVALTIVLGAVLIGWLVSRLPPSTKRSFRVASALFLGFGIYNPGQEKVAEVREEGEHAKRQKAGDPPDTDDPPP
jgi:hypothetical protein